ncbi:trithorax group protein osa-like [Anoplopoma fimbria]|uniref:trithorax group protein osa-like n=1 Tax=Anoplopoma fimbria TaxID=229290 RepID=UPI0023EB988A|nr:trithorax group protein osa-like [Anoplopoma fimbria]
MMAARFFSGASLFALLIVDICCFPHQKGSDPGASYGRGYPNAAPTFDSYKGAPSGQYSPAAVLPNNAPSKGVFTPSYQADPQPTAQRGPEPSVGSSFSSGPVSGYSDSSVRRNPASPSQKGAAFQPGLQEINWAVAPPSPFSPDEGISSGTHGVVSSLPQQMSPPLPPPGPMYQAGELSHFENSFERANSERETEETGLYPPPPPLPPYVAQESAGQGFIYQPQPNSYISGSWDYYPYYDFMFLTGQYPPGTVSHFSSSYEQGRDYWQDGHYVRDYAPYNSAPEQQMETFTGDFAAPQSSMDPNPVMAGYGHGGEQAGPAASRGVFRQPFPSQGGGPNSGKVLN